MIMNHRPSRQENIINHIRHDLSANHGIDPVTTIITIAQMLAIAFGSNDKARTNLRDDEFVLTAEVWGQLLEDMNKSDARLRKTLQLRLPPPNRWRDLTFPASLERIRRHLLREENLLEGECAHPDLIDALYSSMVAVWREPVSVLTREAQDFATECLRTRTGDKIYCAYAASAGLALSLASHRKLHVTLELEGPQDLVTLCAWLTVAGHLDLNIIGCNPLMRLASEAAEQKLTPERSDVAFVCPPADQKTKESDLDQLWTAANLPASTQMCGANAILATTRAQRSICFTDGTFLFHTYKVDQTLKGTLIRNHNLDAVVGLHASVYEARNSNHASMLIFGSFENTNGDTGEKPRVLMVDARLTSYLNNDDAAYGDPDEENSCRIGRILLDRAETDVSYLVSLEAIAEQDFNLVVDRYVYPPGLRRTQQKAAQFRTTLEDVADIYRPQPLPPIRRSRGASDMTFASGEEDPSPFREVGVLDIEDVGLVQRPTKRVPESPELLQRLRKTRLMPGDIIMVVKGSVGKVGYIREIPPDEIWLASQSFVIIRLRRYTEITEPLYLFRFLSSKTGQMLIKPLTVGTAVAGLQMADVRRILVLRPRMGQEEEVVREVKELFAIQDEIETLRQRIDTKCQSIWPEHGLLT